MSYLLVFFLAMVMSMALIPLMIRIAPRLGMVDHPDPRKVHSAPTPRAGGVGIAIGTLIPVLIWAPLGPALRAYLAASLILLGFGMWDDARTLGAPVKFLGQFLAAAVVVYYGRVYVLSLPFMDLHRLPLYLAQPFTVFALVGMINALNVSDGLDGLAGGLSILSLGAIAYLALRASGYAAVAIALATLGGVLGFMRYNTHPARVFMGDAGSQFLGFTLGFLSVFLLQKVNPVLSPALPLLILGLPIADLLAVIVQRLYLGISPFVATKHHVHHRLLALGLDHYEAVVIIYAIQTAFIMLALLMRYDADSAIVAVYLGISGLLFLFLFVMTHLGLKVHASRAPSRLTTAIRTVRNHPLFYATPVLVITLFIPLLFLAVGLFTREVPRDFGVGASILAALLLLHLVFSGTNDSIVLRAISYVTAAFVIYLESKYLPSRAPLLSAAETGYFIVLAATIGLAVRYGTTIEFRTTPMDYLVILIVLSVGLLTGDSTHRAYIGAMAIKLVIVFYGCEFIASRMKSRWNLLNLASLATLTILGLRGLGLA
ncbi:MAG: glycosyltransferase family 4 protein [Acidiferrobacterales bacterium]